MKSDRRHALETNDLADSAAAFAERLRPHLGTLALAAIALLLGAALWSIVGSRRQAAREESWNAVLAALAAGRSEELDKAAGRYPDTPAAQWARMIAADAALERGSQLLAADRAQAEQVLQEAVSRYRTILDANPGGLVDERATFGLAKARESLGGPDNLDAAQRGYTALVAAHPDSALRPYADERIAALGRQTTRQWYDWFAQQKPAPPATDAPDATFPPSTSGDAGQPPPATEPAAPAEPPDPAAPGAAAEPAASVEPDAGSEPAADATPGAGKGTDAPR